MRLRKLTGEQAGFTIIEFVIACIIFPAIVIGLAGAFDTVKRSYTVARQLNEIYAVLSACPEIDRALDFDSISGSTNCFPNNSFKAEGGSGITITYSPTLNVTNTSALDSTDPLKSVPDSKVVDVSVGFPNSTSPSLQLRMLITRRNCPRTPG